MTLLAKIDVFNDKFSNLCTDVNDHERRLVALKSAITDHRTRISPLTSDLLIQESVIKGYKDTNNTTVATLRTDVKDTRARFPELRREVQESTAGLATSIKELAALIHELRQQQRTPVTSKTAPTTPPPVRGASVDLPPTPGTTRFNLHDGLNPIFQGAASFPSGNRPHRDTDAPPDPDAHLDTHFTGRTPTPATPSPLSQGALRRDPSAVTLASLGGHTVILFCWQFVGLFVLHAKFGFFCQAEHMNG